MFSIKARPLHTSNNCKPEFQFLPILANTGHYLFCLVLFMSLFACLFVLVVAFLIGMRNEELLLTQFSK